MKMKRPLIHLRSMQSSSSADGSSSVLGSWKDEENKSGENNMILGQGAYLEQSTRRSPKAHHQGWAAREIAGSHVRSEVDSRTAVPGSLEWLLSIVRQCFAGRAI